MAAVLVVGATGQLGLEVVERLCAEGRHHVRALARRPAQAATLFGTDVEVVPGDLRDRDSLNAACHGIDVVIATATVVFPRGKDNFRDDEEGGYRNLIAACTAAGVRQFIFVSLCVPFEAEFVAASPTYRTKQWIENQLFESPLAYTILRCAPFMDDYFALIGSRIPLRGERAATLDRSAGVARVTRRLFGDSIERFGRAWVPGSSGHRHAFVALGDVAAHAIAAIDHPDANRAIFDIAGPQSASWAEIGMLYSNLLERPVAVHAVPAWVLRGLSLLMRPFSESLSNQLAILWILAKAETRVDSAIVAERLRVRRTSAHEYLAAKLRISESVPRAGS
ncbi:hypothetical protein GCM10011521_20250 [Arenimonas soli]|uniref:NAD(P)-binding domain-containing protein n=1 Tax=Arenimonas soli TaxID=2269504 RepID=A0ABQ1HL76_9GAMM|nr:NAD(P)H-binding protein [Arenimonas soli]GGA81858.1 hypothetical protein GCM10011521_20250 [Arenimonas soli]